MGRFAPRIEDSSCTECRTAPTIFTDANVPHGSECPNPRKDVRRETGAEFALYNPDLRRIDYNQINKPTFL